MTSAQQSIWQVLCRADPGHRNLLPLVSCPDLEALAASLLCGGRVLIVTGFPVLHADGAGETDGPGGTAALAAALTQAGAQVEIATDDACYSPVAAAVADCVPPLPIHVIPREDAAAACRSLLSALRPTHVIGLERPGKAADGHYYNFRSQVIDGLLSDTHTLFTETEAVTIAIGDGGNELGMGAVAAAVGRTAKNGALVCAREPADFTLVAGVSNWWGWGLAAVLSLELEQDLLPSDSAELVRLRRVTDAGGVDGVSGLATQTVDGLSAEENLSILRELRSIVTDSLEKTVAQRRFLLYNKIDKIQQRLLSCL